MPVAPCAETLVQFMTFVQFKAKPVTKPKTLTLNEGYRPKLFVTARQLYSRLQEFGGYGDIFGFFCIR